MTKFQLQFDRCTGPVPKPLVKPKPKSGIEKELEIQKLDAIEREYNQMFGGEKK